MRRPFVFGLTLVGLAAALPARAEVWEFTLDPARSRVGAVAGLYGGGTVDNYGTPQAPGSDAASYAGVLRVEKIGDTIRVLDGSFADALPHPVPMLPGAAGSDAVPAPADYGWVGGNPPGGPGPITAALRDLRFDFFSDPIDFTAPDGGFQNRIAARVGTGRVDYTLNGVAHSFDFAGPDRIPGDDDPSGSLTTDGATQTLTFPFYTTLVSRSASDTTSLDYYIFNGQITATRVVPEPGACVVLLAAAGALLARRRRASV